MTDLVIVSMHEKGFPMADYYQGRGETPSNEFECISPSPDGFFTMKRGDTLEDAFEKAKASYPGAVIVYAAEDELDDEDEQS